MLLELNVNAISVPTRQRRVVESASIDRLADSILEHGLLQPIGVVEGVGGYVLAYGERRLRAVQKLAKGSQLFRFGNRPVNLNHVPAVIHRDIPELLSAEMEFDENEHREPLTWQDRTEALALLIRLRKQTVPETTITSLSRELAPKLQISPHGTRKALTQAELVGAHMDDPDVRKADSLATAFTIVRRKLEAEFASSLALAEKRDNPNAPTSLHRFIPGDAFAELPGLSSACVDSVISDPPYGQGIRDALAGRHTGHSIDLGSADAFALYRAIILEGYRIAKPAAHLWLFCDIDLFIPLRDFAAATGWEPVHTPIIWNKVAPTNSVRDKYGLSRQYELLLHASKGLRPFRSGAGDVITVPYEPGILKPPALYERIMAWTCIPGSIFLDPCCGQGPIFEGARLAGMRAIGIELNPALWPQCEAAAAGRWVSPGGGDAARPSNQQLLDEI